MKIKDEYLEKMEDLVILSKHDPEAAHGSADEILTNLLLDLGYCELVDEFNKVNKWYS